MKPAYIYDAIRSPRTRAKSGGGLNSLSPQQLLSQLYHHLGARCGLDFNYVDEVILGCVTQHGDQAGNIAKTSALYAGLPSSISGLTVSRFCSSSIDATALAGLKIGAGQANAIVAGGVEMMSRVPMLSDQASIFVDTQAGIDSQVLMMGSGADLIASLHGISREECDQLAIQSQQRASHAQSQGFFNRIVGVEVEGSDTPVVDDECIRSGLTLEKLAKLPPAFAELGQASADVVQLAVYPELAEINHVHTAGNSPAMADAAAVILMGDEELGMHLEQSPRARLVASSTASAPPLEVLSGCIAATTRLLSDNKLSVDDVDLFQIHEAFAATSVLSQRQLGIDWDKLNVNGCVIALGHPMGATGAILVGMLLEEMERRDLHTGVAAASGAAGSGSALLIERC